MRSPTILIAMLAAAIVATSAHGGEAVPVGQLDAKLVEAIKSKFRDAELLSASRETDGGAFKHEVKIRFQEEVWEVDVAENGDITEMEREERR